MNLSDWIDCYYPENASEYFGLKRTKKNWRKALKHSIRKWEGLFPLIRNKYKIYLFAKSLIDSSGNAFNIDFRTCSLCYLCSSEPNADPDCNLCLLSKVRDNIPCDQCKEPEELSPFGSFSLRGNPQPMLDLLKKALESL